MARIGAQGNGFQAPAAMTERCPICGLDTFAEDVIRTGYLNSSTIRKCSNCTWQKVIRLSGPGGPAIDKLVSESRKEFLQVLESTGSVRATAAELKSRAFKRQQPAPRKRVAAQKPANASGPRSSRRPKSTTPQPKPPKPSRSRAYLQRAQAVSPAEAPRSGCRLCGNTHPRHKAGSNRCQATTTWRKIDAGEWLKRSEQKGFDKAIAMAWPQQHQRKAVTNVYERAKAGRSIVLEPAGTDATATLTKARVRLWCSLNPGASPTLAFADLYSSSQ